MAGPPPLGHPVKPLPTFDRRFGRKTPAQRAKVEATLRLLAEDPRHPGLHTHKVEGYGGVFESYVDDSMRVTWEWEQGGGILLRNTCQHDPVLRNP